MNRHTSKSNILNAGRFWKMTVFDTQKSLTTTLPIIAIIAAIWMTARIVLYINHGHIGTTVGRGETILLLTTITMAITPAKLYERCNMANSGITFAMLPTSKTEKYLSMLLQCIILIPLLSFAIYYLTDLVTTLITDKYTPPHFSTSNIAYEENRLCMRFDAILSPMLTVAYFVMAATCFKKHKLRKSLIVPIVFFIVTSILFTKLFMQYGETIDWNSLESKLQQLFENIHTIQIVTQALLTTVFLSIGWIVLKRTRY